MTAFRSTAFMGITWLAALAALPAAAADPAPAAIDARLHTSVSTGTHRLLVYRICSPEHCWSDTYLQWLDQASPEPVVKETKPVEELGYGIFVNSARWVQESDKPHLEVQVVPSHADLDERILLLVPKDPGTYETRWKDGGDASGPPDAD